MLDMEADTAEAKDNLMLAKISQAFQANTHRADDFPYTVGDLVMLSTVNRRRDYKGLLNSVERRVAKFMPRYDGPYVISDVHKEASTVTLDMPNAPNVFPTFHTSLVKPFKDNDGAKYPSRNLEKPGALMVDNQQELEVEKIVDCKRVGRGYRYLVHFKGYGKEAERWITGSQLDNVDVVDRWWKEYLPMTATGTSTGTS